jgi:hypothetical protein
VIISLVAAAVKLATTGQSSAQAKEQQQEEAEVNAVAKMLETKGAVVRTEEDKRKELRKFLAARDEIQARADASVNAARARAEAALVDNIGTAAVDELVAERWARKVLHLTETGGNEEAWEEAQNELAAKWKADEEVAEAEEDKLRSEKSPVTPKAATEETAATEDTSDGVAAVALDTAVHVETVEVLAVGEVEVEAEALADAEAEAEAEAEAQPMAAAESAGESDLEAEAGVVVAARGVQEAAKVCARKRTAVSEVGSGGKRSRRRKRRQDQR